MIGSSDSLVGAQKVPEAEHSLNYYHLKWLGNVVDDGSLKKAAEIRAHNHSEITETYFKTLGKPEAEASEAEVRAAVETTRNIHKELIERGRKSSYSIYQNAFDRAFEAIPEDLHNLEFLAKTLHQEEHFLTATPIYVCFA